MSEILHVLEDPGCPSDLLLMHADTWPTLVLTNPQLALISLEDPILWSSIRGKAHAKLGRANMECIEKDLPLSEVLTRIIPQEAHKLHPQYAEFLKEEEAAGGESEWGSLFQEELESSFAFLSKYLRTDYKATASEMNAITDAVNGFIQKCTKVPNPPRSRVFLSLLVQAMASILVADTRQWWEQFGWAAAVRYPIESGEGASTRGRYWVELANRYKAWTADGYTVKLTYPNALDYFQNAENASTASCATY